MASFRDDEIIVRINGSVIKLKQEDAILYFNNDEDDSLKGNERDIAIFKLDGISSPIIFDSSEPEDGMLLKSVSYKRRVEVQKIDSNFLGGKIGIEHYDLIECDATVIAKCGNFFMCETEIILEPGSSGSPILNGNKVIGILTSGVPGQNKCVFLSSQSILKLLDSLK